MRWRLDGADAVLTLVIPVACLAGGTTSSAIAGVAIHNAAATPAAANTDIFPDVTRILSSLRDYAALLGAAPYKIPAMRRLEANANHCTMTTPTAAAAAAAAVHARPSCRLLARRP